MEQYSEPQPIRPVRPEEVVDLQKKLIPPEVIETFNRFIGSTVLNGRAVVKQREVVDALAEKGLDRSAIYDNGWLNVEDIYRDAGWKVVYDKPGYNESYPPTFTFTAKK